MSNSPSSPLILTIDAGTQSVRAITFDLQGNLVAKSQVPMTNYLHPQTGWVEFDAEHYWQLICAACQDLWEQIDPTLIKGVALTSQRATTVNMDRDGNPLRPAISWMDQRVAESYEPVKGLWGTAFKVLGLSDTIDYFQAQAEANWLQLHQPQVWKNTYKFGLLSSFLHHRLSGCFVDAAANQVGYLPFDFKHAHWAKSRDWKWQAVCVERDKLVELVQAGELLGHISANAFEQTGIPLGTPIIAAAGDKACEALGAGCLSPHVAFLSLGSAANISITTKKFIEPVRFLPSYPAALPKHYNAEIQIFRGFWLVEQFRKQFAEHASYDDLDAMLASTPAGNEGLILQPYWSPGALLPGLEAKGAMIGFDDRHTQAHSYRAIIEGLMYALREGAERLQRKSKTPLTSLRIAGGGSQSDKVMQIAADVFGLPTTRPHTYETSALGAAIDCAVGLGLHDNFAQASDAMTRLNDTFEPNLQNHKVYDELYRHVYKKMYRQLRPLYKSLQALS